MNPGRGRNQSFYPPWIYGKKLKLEKEIYQILIITIKSIPEEENMLLS
jgi:hypothetical protein